MSGWEWLDSGTSGGRSPDLMSVFFSGEVVPLCLGLVFGICCGESHLLFLGMGACGLRVGVCSLCQRGVVAAVGWSWLLLGAPLPPCRGSRCLLRRAACLSFAWLSAFVPPAGGSQVKRVSVCVCPWPSSSSACFGRRGCHCSHRAPLHGWREAGLGRHLRLSATGRGGTNQTSLFWNFMKAACKLCRNGHSATLAAMNVGHRIKRIERALSEVLDTSIA